MKVALAQTNIIWEDKPANEAYAFECIDQAAKLRAQAVFFPEMSLTGFSMNTNITSEKDQCTLEKFRRIAAREDIAIGIGWTKQGGTLAENHYSVIGKNGYVLSDYIKIHPFSYAKENEFFLPGNQITYFELGNYTWSSFICYDLRFPELFQIAAQTADVILIAANWPQTRKEHWKCLLRARAIEAQCYIIAVNCVGKIHDIEYSGNSCGISPNGDILDELENEQGLLTIDLKEDVKVFRKNFPVRQDRKWDFYATEYGRQK